MAGFNNDPTVPHGIVSTMPLRWTQEVFELASYMWENAAAHGLMHGWAQSARDAKGVAGMLTLFRGAERITEPELRANQPKMRWLVQVAHAGRSRILTPRLLPEADPHFTPREIEILCRTADGKKSAEIEHILSISVATVNFHIINAVAKLGKTNKTQAVVKAVLPGIFRDGNCERVGPELLGTLPAHVESAPGKRLGFSEVVL